MKYQWSSIKETNTWVLLVEHNTNMIPEWRVAGHVLKRQVYPGVPAAYYGFVTTNDHIPKTLEVGAREDLGAMLGILLREAEQYAPSTLADLVHALDVAGPAVLGDEE